MTKGFTIIELIIYMGLLATFLLVVTNVFLTALEVQTQAEATSNLQIDGRYILSRLSYDLHRSTTASAPTADTLALDVGTYSVVNGGLALDTDYLNSYATQISNFTVTQLGNTGSGVYPSFQITFTLTDGSQSQDFQVTVGARPKL